MAKRFDTLRGQMCPEAQAQAALQAQETLQGMPASITPGQMAYAAFTRVFDPQHVQWRLWPDMPRKMQLAWEAAARAVLEARAMREEEKTDD